MSLLRAVTRRILQGMRDAPESPAGTLEPGTDRPRPPDAVAGAVAEAEDARWGAEPGPHPDPLPGGEGEGATRRHLRGSALLLAGRLFGLVTNFFVQVVTVRYLAKSDFGAFAYALSVVAMASMVNLLGLHRTVNRFIPIYHERRDYGSLFGTLVLAVGTVLGFGVALVVLTFGLSGILAAEAVTDPLSVSLLLILIALAPLEALDALFQGVAASLASPRAIFLRRHVLHPGLKLGSVLVVVLLGGSVRLLAACYLVAGAFGVLVYALLIHRVLRDRGLLRYLDPRSLRLPFRRLFGSSIPLMSTDIVMILWSTMAVVILERVHGSASVADLRAVVPIAALTLLVFQSHKILYTPLASRLFAREDAAGLNELYRQSAIWIAVLTFPVLAVCLFLAEPVTELLFGGRYAASQGSPAPTILAILAAGSYVNAAMGLNAYTLQVFGEVRLIACINGLATAAGLALGLFLIPRFGAVGAALTTASSVVLYNLLNHVGLRLRTPIRIFERHGFRVNLTVIGAVLALALVSALLRPPVAAMAALVAAASLALVRVNRRSLNVEATFPELLRVPVLRRFLSAERRRP